MTDVYYQEITPEETGQRLDNYLIRILKGVPKSHVYRMIRGGEVRVNKKRAKPSSRLTEGDSVRIPPVRTSTAREVHVGSELMEHLHACILYEDAHLMVINKPAGLAVHGGSGLSLGLIEALRKIRPELAYLELVHRLDKETSGCLLLAKKRSMLRSIHALLAARQVEKIYWAIVASPWVGQEKIRVNQPLEKNTLQSGERMVKISEAGKPSETGFRLIENYSNACWVEAKPKTGRTHQIRVHGAFIKHPVLGDARYDKLDVIHTIKGIAPRLYLHARAIRFTLDDKDYAFEAPVDDKFTQAFNVLRTQNKEHQKT